MSPIEVDPPPGATPSKGLTTPRQFPSARVWILALMAGLIAGFTSWLIGEAIHGRFGPPELVVTASPSGGFLGAPEIHKLRMAKRAAQTLEATLTFGSLGAVLGLALGLAGGSARGSARAALSAAIAGAILGGVVGAALTEVVLPIYFRFLNPDTNDLILGILIQVVISSGIGAVGGAAFGIGFGDRSHAVRAALGGLLGATAGVLVYEMVGALAFPTDGTSNLISATWVTRLFARLAVTTLASAGPLASYGYTVSRRAAALVMALLLAGIASAVWPSLRTISRFNSKLAASSPRLRDVYAGSQYRNARLEVGYVGDAACVRCHREIAEAYSSHPMGRSLAPVGGPEEDPPTGAAPGLPVEVKGLRYTVERRDGRVFHKAMRRDSAGEVISESEAEVRYALGSGRHGINFLIERDGFLFLSPIAWFAQERRWDLSPGSEGRSQPTNFERAVHPECLFCHTNQVRPVAGPMNRYETPIFRGHAIGCERCHGPGELHVNRGEESAKTDLTIVNPAELAPALRDSVCQQCHLQGAFRTTRAGRGAFDFRPGLPIHRFWAVFQMKKGDRDQFEAVGHVEQIESSRCFRESQGQLGCISCHDPHRLPEPSTKAAYYRDRCMECHERKGCALPLAERQSRRQGEDCVACHMPRLAVANIPHTAATDHRIARGGPGSVRDRPRAATAQPGEIPLVDYHWGLMTEEERQDAGRDLGVASAWISQRLDASPKLAGIAATQALPLLEAAVRDRPDDLYADYSLGVAHEILGRGEEALRAFEGTLRINPGHELALRDSGRLLASLQRPTLARAMLQKTIAVNPWRSDYRLALARICSQAGDWPGAIAACREAIQLDPNWSDPRSLLVECFLRANEREKADAEFRTLLRFYPASRAVWQQWYEQQK